MGKRKKRKRCVFTPYAAELLKAYFGWGLTGVFNAHEQACALGGRMTKNAAVIEAVLPMLADGASRAHVKVKAETWLSAVWTLEDMGMKLIGGAHSHPGALPVFMSSEDKTAHARMYPRGVSVVLNPQRKEIAGYDKNQNAVEIKMHGD